MLFHPLHTGVTPPPRFTYPFCYEPHPLCLMAAAEVQEHIARAGGWRAEADRGKMFGVLVVARADGALGYLAAYSGQLDGRNDLPFFVPAVYDMLRPGDRFKTGEAAIETLSARIAALEADEGLAGARRRLDSVRREGSGAVAAYRALIAEAKLRRNALRAERGDSAELTRESQHQKAELRRLKRRWAEAEGEAQRAVEERLQAIGRLKAERRRLSDGLQRWLFSQFRMLNARGQERDLNDIFEAETGGAPPAGAGECCAPKLLQYAYRNGLRPLCMAEFWWGGPPRTELRRHLHYYPACRGKCLPILRHMLQGLDVDPDPLADDDGGRLDTVWEDASLAVVAKPAGMLSVPGNTGRRSVFSILGGRWGDGCAPLMVHRLDMDTSGLLLVAKTEEAARQLRAQFEARSVRKGYVALLDTTRLDPPEGRIALPLRPDPLDRPRQVVDFRLGRQAVTSYRLLSAEGGRVRVELHPVTGRTHQLRVHCAHPLGLGAPIVGDPLYGRRGPRLLLHAASIEFVHPDTGRRMTFRFEPEF